MEIEKKSKDIKSFPNSKVSNLLHLKWCLQMEKIRRKAHVQPNYSKLQQAVRLNSPESYKSTLNGQ
jgi:hypothetical protein